MPFIKHKKQINEFIAKQFAKTAEGLSIEDALEKVGAFARNISVKAFSTKGYGEWDDLDPQTIKRKGSSKPLIDTGTLRNAITWVVRND